VLTKFCAAFLIALTSSPLTAPFSTWNVSPQGRRVPTHHALPSRVPMDQDQFASHGAVSLPETIAQHDAAASMPAILPGMPDLHRSSTHRTVSDGRRLLTQYSLLPSILRL
jgi:hypothetical protein